MEGFYEAFYEAYSKANWRFIIHPRYQVCRNTKATAGEAVMMLIDILIIKSEV